MIGWPLALALAVIVPVVVLVVVEAIDHRHKRNHEYRMARLEQDHEIATGTDADDATPDESPPPGDAAQGVLWCGQHGRYETPADACGGAYNPNDVDWLTPSDEVDA